MAETSFSSPGPCALPKAIGITIIVTSGDNPSRTLTFWKSSTPVINIGRMPSTKLPQTDVNDTAWFRCAVVSRKHAKIFFADNGQVYLVDLCSHHGTQILKPGETVSKKIEPESPAPLSDGDVVTFGKSVGRDVDIVRPVSARVKLLLQSNSNSQDQSSDSVDELLEISCKSSPIRKPSTGRYGVAHSSPSSSSSSDIEEIDGPEILPIGPPLNEDEGKMRGIGLLKHVLPPINFPTTPSRSSSFLSAAHEPLGAGSDTKFVYSLLSDHHSEISERTIPVIVDSHSQGQIWHCEGGSDIDVPEVVGAWPNSPVSPISRTESPILMWEPMLHPEVTEILDDSPEPLWVEKQDDSIPLGASSERAASEQILPHQSERSPSLSLIEPNDSHSQPSGNTSGSGEEDAVAKDVNVDSKLKEEVSKIKDTVDQVFTDVQLLRYSKRKAASHIHRAEKKLQTLETRLTHVDSLCASNASCISDLIDAELLKMDGIDPRPAENENQDAILRELLQEMKLLREQITNEITQEIEALKVAREEASAAITTMAAQIQTSLPRMKRKRCEESAEDEDGTSDSLHPAVKRSRRRIVSKVLQTAGVFTIGAAATWTALAFS